MQTVEVGQVRGRPDHPVSPRGSEYAQLSRQVKHAGLLNRRVRHYLWKIGAIAVLLVGGWLAFGVVGDSWWQLFVAAFLAFVFTQLGFLGHDAGHKQIFASSRANYVVGILHGNLAIGLSYGWWVEKHNRHHAHPNQEEMDPDVGPGVLAWTTGQARTSRGLIRWISRYQAFLFFPLLLLEAVSLHVNSIQALSRRGARHRRWEGVLLATHAVGYLAAVFLVLSPLRAVVFIVVQQALFGLYLGCSFAPNHKGMVVFGANERVDFLRRQVLTSRNVRGGRLIDFVFGGLNYQIEHHLFPSMPRPNLRRAQLLVADFCRQHGVPYTQTSVVASYVQGLRYLHAVGRPLRQDPVHNGVWQRS